MVEYAVVLSGSFGESLRNTWYDLTNLLSTIPSYWYIVALIGLVVLIKLLTSK